MKSLILINRKKKLKETFDSDNGDHYYGFKSPLLEAQVMCDKENQDNQSIKSTLFEAQVDIGYFDQNI